MADFGGTVAEHYARYRRGYPPAVIDAICAAFGLGPDDTVVDLGCGTGQLTVPLSTRVRAVAGVDPEPDMLAQARRRPGTNVAWIVGTDADLPAIGRLLGGGIGAVTAAVAIHWMDRDTLFRAAKPLLRPGGGVAVVTNGAPLWLQDTPWSRALRVAVEEWTGRPVGWSCQTDEAGRALNAEALSRAGFEVFESTVDYDAPLSVEEAAGGMLSAMAVPAGRHEEFTARIGGALAVHLPVTEHVTVTVQCGRTG
jgi:SAM-dependent methyltransferase